MTFGVALILQQAARDISVRPASTSAPAWLPGYRAPRRPLPMTRLFILGSPLCVTVPGLRPEGHSARAPDPGCCAEPATSPRPPASRPGGPTTTFFIGSGPGRYRRCRADPDRVHQPDTGHQLHYGRLPGGGGRRHRPDQGRGHRRLRAGRPAVGLRIQHDGSAGQGPCSSIIVVFLQLRPQGMFNVRTRSLV